MLEIGSVFYERYEILRILGRGGMSVVYLARDQKLGCSVAIKESLKVDSEADKKSFERSLMIEAQILRQLNHPAIPAVYDIIEGSEHLCIIMEYIDGKPLDRLLREAGPQSVEKVVDWAQQLAQFLSFLHEHSVVYRDMKPANVILCPDGRLKVVDFGAARSMLSSPEQSSVGTRGYAPPEQYEHRDDLRADIFSLGMTLHHLLTGIVPTADKRYFPVCHWKPNISTSLSAIIDKCVQPDPAFRYQNCQELLSALNYLATNVSTENADPDLLEFELDFEDTDGLVYVTPTPGPTDLELVWEDRDPKLARPISSILSDMDTRTSSSVDEKELTDAVRKLLFSNLDGGLPKIKRHTVHLEMRQIDSISWCNITNLSIIGILNRDVAGAMRAAGLRSGAYINPAGNWLLLFDVNTHIIQACIAVCGTSLKNLLICHSGIGALRLDNIRNLETLSLYRNRHLREITGLNYQQNLRDLDVSYTGLDGTVSLSGLNSLVGLCIRGTRICRISIEHPLPNLTILVAPDSSLTEMDFLLHVPNLKLLDLMHCPVQSIPSEMLRGLTELRHLDVSFTKIRELPHLDTLEQLDYLDCGDTNIVFTQDFRFPPHLSFLRLSRTPNRFIPDGICKLTYLRNLHLSGLSLKELPNWLPEIASHFDVGQTYMGSICLDRCVITMMDTTIDGVDMSIFEQHYLMVIEWFKKRSLNEIQPLNEIKVVFLGDGEAGKSHTIARLMNDGGNPDHAVFDGQSTPGIVIRNKEYDLGDRKIQVRYWDFGGQEIMHSMHRIFLTSRTMYVILLNARDDTQSDRAKYWLHNVKSFAPDAPVLLVLNKIDQNEKASVDERDLRGRYDKLTQVVRLSAKDFSRDEFNDRFTKVLLEEIQKTGFLDAQWPTVWTSVKEKLENMETHYITGSDYRTICQECKVDDNQKNLLHWFNDLGISFCCDGEDDYTLEDYVILRPDWITNALYIILFNSLAGARNGLIPHRSIYNLLRNAHANPEIRCTLPQARYTTGDIDYVLRIMRKFNLSFTDGQNNEFIPMLCQQNSLVDIQYYQKDADILEFNMEFDYLPNNLLHRLMVERYNELDMDTVWRTGAQFQLTELGFSAVVVIDGNTLRFFIRHADPMHRPNTYLTMLKAHVERIVAKMGLKAPSCKLVYKLDGKRDEFDFENLKLWHKLGMPGVPSPSHGIVIPFQDIFNQSAPDNLNDEKKLLDRIIQACGNIQDEPIYRLVPKSDGQGYVNGKGMEDLRNRRVRDNLINIGYRMNDQTQRGSSSTGKSIGELDMLVYNDSNEPWTIIEALRVSDNDKSEWNKHLKKLSDNYNTRGFPALYLLTYVDADTTTFAQIWESYQYHIKAHHPGQLKYSDGSFVELNVPNHQYIKVAKCRYSGGVDPIIVYHIFARIPIQNG